MACRHNHEACFQLFSKYVGVLNKCNLTHSLSRNKFLLTINILWKQNNQWPQLLMVISWLINIIINFITVLLFQSCPPCWNMLFNVCLNIAWVKEYRFDDVQHEWCYLVKASAMWSKFIIRRMHWETLLYFQLNVAEFCSERPNYKWKTVGADNGLKPTRCVSEYHT